MQLPAIEKLVGEDPAFLDSIRVIRKLAGSDVTVLIQGETGTGKELAARAIHYLGRRREHPFTPVNCGAIPDDLIENEFFGHLRGAFTDARDTQPGLVASTEGGTLFLDEVESLSPRAQVVLLRFLQDGAYRPLGGRKDVKANVRIVAATKTDVAELVRSGSFREDLMYRLAIVTVTMPALRDRPGDILLLARHFLGRLAREYGLEKKELGSESIAALLQHPWPGNVRELENLLHREFLMTEGAELRIRTPSPGAHVDRTHVPLPNLPTPPLELGFRRAKAMVIAEFEKEFLTRALEASGGNVTEAARITGKERRALGKLLKKHGMRTPS